jgi:ABC-type multidrug transport system fused ATPase/permease subunit
MDVLIVFTALSLILTRDGMTGAAAGFVLAFAGSIAGDVNWVLINIRQFEIQGVSLERTAEYRKLEREEGAQFDVVGSSIEDQLVADQELEGWPAEGALNVEELSARYGPDLPNILHEVSFSVQGGQRVGIVGATGGGKSTLAKAFFSFVDITHGKIEIDGKGELTSLTSPSN